MSRRPARPRVIAWGTYDLSKPRTRILLEALRDGADVVECHADVWSDVVDKSQLAGLGDQLKIGARWAKAYAGLVARYLRMPRADVVFVGYLGQLDVLLLRPLARLRGERVVWDAFISLYDTVVNDRQLVSPDHIVARALWLWEWLACRAADVVVLDTDAHAAYFKDTFGLDDHDTAAVFVGAEGAAFPPVPPVPPVPHRKHERDEEDEDDEDDEDDANDEDDKPLSVVFYGQFIPLHGIACIVEAARRSDPRRVQWTLIGKGQETARIQAMLVEQPLSNLRWIPWVEYADLAAHLAAADVCLGIFGDSDKAARVIPNKVFQILAVGKPLITRDSPAIRELIDGDDAEAGSGIRLVPPMDPAALLTAIEALREQRPGWSPPLHRRLVERFSRAAIADKLSQIIQQASSSRRSP